MEPHYIYLVRVDKNGRKLYAFTGENDEVYLTESPTRAEFFKSREEAKKFMDVNGQAEIVQYLVVDSPVAGERMLETEE